MSASNTVSQLKLESATASSRFELDFKERTTTNEIKCEPVQTAAEELLLNESYATANISLLAEVTKCNFNSLIEFVFPFTAYLFKH